MEEFFNTIYYYTNFLYGEKLDNYLYEIVPGYIHVGIVMVCLSLLTTITFYYVVKPIRHQMATWIICVALNAFINLLVAMWYTNTPLINNEIDESKVWTVLDTFGFSGSNVIWSFVFLLGFSRLIKWWSPSKFIPFKKF